MLSTLLRALRRRHSGARGAAEEGHAALLAGKWQAAEAAFRSALTAGDDGGATFHGLGVALWRQGRLDEGLQALQLAVERSPRDVHFRLWLAAALERGAPLECVAQLNEARKLAPDDRRIDARVHKPLMEACAWDAVDAELAALEAHAASEPPERWSERVDPFVALLLPVRKETRRLAALWHARRVAGGAKPLGAPPPPPAQKLRLGYVAAEFNNHATAHLMAGLFEQHDRGRFEITAYSFGRDDGSDYARRVRAAFDRFTDIGALADADAARRIAADGIDVLIDLKGYTAGARPAIFAHRPAPVQVSYVGYPGSMQAPFIDYLVADARVVPRADFGEFSEAPVWLPASYQPNDDRQPIAPQAGPRAAHGLPEDAVVYCSFNRAYKIERAMFAAWMRILAAVPRSVLWLLADNPDTEASLRRAASGAGVDPARLVFAPRKAKPEHLARHRHADLFLDTHTVNAHTTASDALWAGLPVLTWPGDSFAGRVAASLLYAVGLPELAVAALEDYEREAIALGRDAGRRAALRARLAENRLSRPLFSTAAYVRDLEAAFCAMHERRRAGRPPEAFAV